MFLGVTLLLQTQIAKNLGTLATSTSAFRGDLSLLEGVRKRPFVQYVPKMGNSSYGSENVSRGIGSWSRWFVFELQDTSAMG